MLNQTNADLLFIVWAAKPYNFNFTTDQKTYKILYNYHTYHT